MMPLRTAGSQWEMQRPQEKVGESSSYEPLPLYHQRDEPKTAFHFDELRRKCLRNLRNSQLYGAQSPETSAYFRE